MSEKWGVVFHEKHGDYVWKRVTRGKAEYAISEGTHPLECEKGPYLVNMARVAFEPLEIVTGNHEDVHHLLVCIPANVKIRCSFHVAIFLMKEISKDREISIRQEGKKSYILLK